jgi:hypothetical protein
MKSYGNDTNDAVDDLFERLCREILIRGYYFINRRKKKK